MGDNKSIANLIIDNLDFSKIYKTTIKPRVISEEEKYILLQQLENVDCKKMYDSFINAGINPSDASGYVINLLIDGGYKEYSLEELSNLDNLDEIISKNIKNLKSRVQAIKLDRIFGINDDCFEVEGTEIKLRDYQYDTLQNINKIFEDKRFAGMILPTGAGKSFVAMAEMMNFKNSNIVFVAPQNAILLQFQKHIVKNILKRDDVELKDLSKVVEEAFPHLKMYCYDTIAVRDEEWLKSLDADLIILDEAHRAGAETYEPQIEKMIKVNPKSKVLAMTATPIRDVDHIDMMRRIAEMFEERTTKELKQKNYLASEMYLLDAMREGIVVCPKIVTFDYSLEDSQEYKEVKRMLEEETDKAKKEQLKDVYDRMTDIIEASKKEGMSKILLDNIKKKDGRYIIFLPVNKDADIRSEQYMENKTEEVKEYFSQIDSEPEVSYLLADRSNKRDNLKALESFELSNSDNLKLILAINMLNEGVHVDNIDGAMMLRPISDNSKILFLQQIGRCIFSVDPDNPVKEEDIPVIFDVYNNYLAQNMDRELNKTNTTSDLERLKLVITWINRHKGYIPDINSENIAEARKAIILKNIQSKYKKHLDGIKNKNLNESEIYEIEKIIELGNTIDLWSLEIPDREVKEEEKEIIKNNTFKVTGTQREFMDLFKEAKMLRKTRKLTSRLRLKDTLSILEILTEYGIEINNQTINTKSRLKDIIKELPEQMQKDILSEADVAKEYEIGQEYNYAKQSFFYGNAIFTQFEMRDLRKYGIFESFFDEKKHIKQSAVINDFITRSHGEFRNINIKTGTIYDEEGYDKDGYNYEGYDRDGYDRRGLDIDNFPKGKTHNKYGFDKQGIHVKTHDIYDEHGFKTDRKHKETGDIYDSRGFDIEGNNKETGTNYDTEGYDIDGLDKDGFSRDDMGQIKINKYGFDKNGYYYEKQEDGTYESTGLKYNKFGFMADKRHVITRNRVDLRRFDIDGICKQNNDSIYDANGFKQDGTYRETGEYYHNGYNAFGVDINGRDKKGYKHPDIIFAKEYIDATYRGKRKELLITYKRTHFNDDAINTVLYRASQMYPPIQKYILNNILAIQKAISAREQKILELQVEKEQKEQEIAKLERENQILKQRMMQMSGGVLEREK